MQDHYLIRAQAKRFIRPAITITKLDLKGSAVSQDFNYSAHLSAPQIVFRQINSERYYVKEFDCFYHLSPLALIKDSK